MGWKVTFNATKRVVTREERAEELASDPYLSIWEPDTGTVVDLDDLTPETIEQIAKAEDGPTWFQVYTWPGQSPTRLQRVLVACAAHAGIDAPSEAATMRDFYDRYNNWLEVTQPIDEKPFRGGFPQTPGGPENGSSSTSPCSTDGPQTSSNDSPSEGS